MQPDSSQFTNKTQLQQKAAESLPERNKTASNDRQQTETKSLGTASRTVPAESPDSRSDRTFNKSSAAAPIHAGRIEYDARGRVISVAYPDGIKERAYQRDANGNVIAITTKDANGSRSIRYLEGHWVTDIEGQQVCLPGNIFVNHGGDFSTQLDANGLWRTERPDGTILQERSTVLGARLAFDEGQRLTRITRRDGTWICTIIAATDTSEMVESNNCGSTLSWTLEPSTQLWTCKSRPGQVRLHLQLHDNGNTTWLDEAGRHHIVRGDGTMLVEPPDSKRFSFDQQGRIESITYPGQTRTRRFWYKAWSTELESLALIEPEKPTRIYQATNEPGQWQITDEAGKKLGIWRGQVQLESDGTYAVRQVKGPQEDANDNGLWKTYSPDGTEAREYISEEGARAIYNTSGRLQTVIYTDGCRLDVHYEDSRMTLLTELDVDGTISTWRKQPGGLWTQDNSASVRANVSFNKRGDMLFLDSEGRKRTVKTNGREELYRADGSTVTYNRKGAVLSTCTANDERRHFEYDDQQRLVRITSQVSLGGADVWMRRANDNVEITAEGDIIIRAPDGQLLAIERSTFERLDFDKDGKLIRVIALGQ